VNTTENTKNKSADEEILKIAKERFNLAVDAETEIRKLALEDIQFSAGDQWPQDVKSARDQDRRPCLTINRIPQFIHQITNDQRQNRPSIKVSPVDDQADVETAKIIQGLVRHVEYSSDADVAYDTAFGQAVRSSFGFFRVLTEFTDPLSFVQDIKIAPIRNQFSAYLDLHRQMPDGSDANWGFVFEDLSTDEFKAAYPKAKLSEMHDWDSLGAATDGWMSGKSVRVAEYFYREWESETIVQVVDQEGKRHTLKKSELTPNMPVEILDERTTQVPKIKWCKINGIEILESRPWPGKWIPIIPVQGEEIIVEGKRILESLVRHAKDPQRMYNYWASSETEAIALAPRAPFIGVEGQFEGYENQWKTANVKNHAYLEYKAKSVGGQPAGPPQRNAFEPAVQAITQARMQASDDLKSTTGIYDAALGNRSSENSGVAIQRRSQQSQTSNFHFVDNLSRSIKHCGRIIVDLIPSIYDTPRAARILGEDMTEEIVQLNQKFEHNGKTALYDLSVGQYDVAVDTGPSYATKRQEAVASMLDMSRSAPQLMQVAGDIVVKNMDWPGAQDIAERIKKTLPPGIADDPKDQNQQIPPQVKQAMDQQGQLIEQLTEQLKHKTGQIETKSLELKSRERIEMAKLQVQLEIAMAQINAKDAQALLAHEVGAIQHRLNMLGMQQPVQNEQAPQPEANEPGEAMPQNTQEQQPTGGSSPGQNPMGV
jgi:hypothetical protein